MRRWLRSAMILAVPFTVDISRFRFGVDKGVGVAGRRVLITGAGKDGRLGQALALGAGLNGAAGEAVHHHQATRVVLYLIAPDAGPWSQRPRYTIANFAVVALPEVLRGNLGKSAGLVSALSICYPFIRTGMTCEYADNPKVFGQWQPRVLEPHEAAEAFLDLLSRPAEQTAGGIYELLVDGTRQALDISWRRLKLVAQDQEP